MQSTMPQEKVYIRRTAQMIVVLFAFVMTLLMFVSPGTAYAEGESIGADSVVTDESGAGADVEEPGGVNDAGTADRSSAPEESGAGDESSAADESGAGGEPVGADESSAIVEPQGANAPQRAEKSAPTEEVGAADDSEEVAIDDEMPVDKVSICHATASTSNPYVENEPAVDSTINPPLTGHGGHTGPLFEGIEDSDWGDIIPPFYYLDNESQTVEYFSGLNWDDSGQAIYYNGCDIPTQPEDQVVVPHEPEVHPAVCPDEVTEESVVWDTVTAPEDTEAITYGDVVEGDDHEVTITATLSDGYAWGELSGNWMKIDSSTAVWSYTLKSVVCTVTPPVDEAATPAVPVVHPATCTEDTIGETVWETVAAPTDTEAIDYSAVMVDGDHVATITATLSDGFEWGELSGGWNPGDDGAAVWTYALKSEDCHTETPPPTKPEEPTESEKPAKPTKSEVPAQSESELIPPKADDTTTWPGLVQTGGSLPFMMIAGAVALVLAGMTAVIAARRKEA